MVLNAGLGPRHLGSLRNWKTWVCSSELLDFLSMSGTAVGASRRDRGVNDCLPSERTD
jgi:hypothetical protein